MCPRDQLRSCVGGSALLILFPFILAFSFPAARAQQPQNQAREYEPDGKLALEQKNYAAAVRDFQLTLKLDPSSAIAHSGLGIALSTTRITMIANSVP